jgi:TetR/AcrR family transcriptional regulator, lmrAB and yxaGH operons repressor
MQAVSAKPKHRQAIVAAAVRLFRRPGFAATGLAQIVEASGAPKGSLYHYFPAGKAAIGAAAVTAAGATVSATIAALPKGERPGDFLREYSRLMAGWMRTSGYRDGCPIATTVLEEAADTDAIAAAAQAAISDWRDALADRLSQTANPEALALLVTATVEGALILARAARSDAPILEAGETLAALIDAAGGAAGARSG